MGEATKGGLVSVAGGGETLSMMNLIEGSAKNFTHVSTGGVASLELMQGKSLPGVVALSNASLLDNIKL